MKRARDVFGDGRAGPKMAVLLALDRGVALPEGLVVEEEAVGGVPIFS
jgi:hypothetical protein